MKALVVFAVLGAGVAVGLLACRLSPFVFFDVLQGAVLVGLVLAGLRREAHVHREESMR
jgi:hypothetical protein